MAKEPFSSLPPLGTAIPAGSYLAISLPDITSPTGFASYRVTAEQIADTADGWIPETREIATPAAGGLSGGGELTSNLSLTFTPVNLTTKTSMGATDTFAINDASLNTAAKVTFSNSMKALTSLTALAFPSLTDDYLIINRAADGLTYKINPSSLSLAAGNVPAGGSTGQFLKKNSGTNYDTVWDTALISVALAMPAIFTVSGSPVTTSGTLTASLATQAANLIWAGPTTGAAATPTFRSLVAADIPTLPTTSFGNPTGTIGLTAVNGVATTAIRSDGAPALSQTIVPTWTGIHTFSTQVRALYSAQNPGQDPAWAGVPVTRIPGVTYGTASSGIAGGGTSSGILSIIGMDSSTGGNLRTFCHFNKSLTMRGVNNNVSVNVANEVPGQNGAAGAFRGQNYAIAFITNVTNAAGLFRITVADTGGMDEGDPVAINGVDGDATMEAAINRDWSSAVNVTATTFDLDGSTFVGTYTSGGRVALFTTPQQMQMIMVGTDTTATVTGVTDASGLIRVTMGAGVPANIIAQDTVTIEDVLGNNVAFGAAVNGTSRIINVTATTFDLFESTFPTPYTYTSGGIVTWSPVLLGDFGGEFRFLCHTGAESEDVITVGYPIVTLETGVRLKVTSAGTAANPAIIIGSGGSPAGVYSSTAGNLNLASNGVVALSLDNSNRVLVSSSITAGLTNQKLEISTTTTPFGINYYSAGAGANATMTLGHVSSGTVGNHGALQNNYNMFKVVFAGDDGASFQIPGASINGVADANWSAGVTPGRMELYTAVSAGTLTEWIAADSTQRIRINRNVTVPVNSDYLTNAIVLIKGADATSPVFQLKAFAGNQNIVMMRANGTSAAKTQVLNTQTVGTIGARAYTSGSAYSTANRAQILFVASEDQTATAQGQDITFQTTAPTTTTTAEIGRFTNLGLLLGGTGAGVPLIKRNSTAVNFRLGDDSADAPISASIGTFSTRVNIGGATSSFPAIRNSGDVAQFYLADNSAAAYFHWAGQARVATQFNKTTDTTLANVTGLTINVRAGKTYSFTAILFVTADAVGGHKYAMAGTATATAVIYQINSIRNDTNANVVNSQQVALAGSAGAAGGTTIHTTITGTITVNAAGTLTVQFAQNAANGISGVLVGSSLIAYEIA